MRHFRETRRIVHKRLFHLLIVFFSRFPIGKNDEKARGGVRSHARLGDHPPVCGRARGVPAKGDSHQRERVRAGDLAVRGGPVRMENKPTKAVQAEVVLATRRGLIVGAFTADHWLPATSANFPGHEDAPGRRGFVGSEAPAELRHLYVETGFPPNTAGREPQIPSDTRGEQLPYDVLDRGARMADAESFPDLAGDGFRDGRVAVDVVGGGGEMAVAYLEPARRMSRTRPSGSVKRGSRRLGSGRPLPRTPPDWWNTSRDNDDV